VLEQVASIDDVVMLFFFVDSVFLSYIITQWISIFESLIYLASRQFQNKR